MTTYLGRPGIRLLLCFVVGGFALALASAQEPVPNIQCQLSIDSLKADSANLTTDCTASGVVPPEVSLVAIRFPGQEIQSIEWMDSGQRLEPQVASQLVRLELPPGARSWKIRYRIAGNTRRVALLVPEGSWQADVEILIQDPLNRPFKSPPFPMFEEDGEALKASLSHFPGFLFLPLGDVGGSAEVISFPGLMDLLIVFVILLCSVYWQILRRRASKARKRVPSENQESG